MMFDAILLLHEISYIGRKYNTNWFRTTATLVSILPKWLDHNDNIMIALTIKLQIGLNL